MATSQPERMHRHDGPADSPIFTFGLRMRMLALIGAVAIGGNWTLALAQTVPEQHGILTLGKFHERALARHETHRWALSTTEDAYVRVLVSGMDVDIVLRTSNGDEFQRQLIPDTTAAGLEAVWIARNRGGYVIEIANGTETAGTYGIGTVEQRSPRSDDWIEEANRLSRDARTSAGAARYHEAQLLRESAVAIYERELGSQHPLVAAELNSLGTMYGIQGLYDDARRVIEAALHIRQQAADPDPADIAESLNSMGMLHRVQGLLTEARPFFEESVAMYETALGPNHPYLAMSMRNLAVHLRDLGEYERAGQLFERALAITQHAYGPVHAEVALSLNTLGHLRITEGNYEAAVTLLQRGLAIREELLEPNHPHIAMSLNNLAHVFKARGEFGAARPLLERALAIRQTAWGPEHPEVAMSLHNLAALFQHQADHSEAMDLYRQALAMEERFGGAQHPNLAWTLVNMAEIARELGALEESRNHLERAIAIREQALGPDHPEVATALNHLGALLDELGDGKSAHALHRRALDVQERALGPAHPDLAQTLLRLAATTAVDTPSSVDEKELWLEQAIQILDGTSIYPLLRSTALYERARFRKQRGEEAAALRDLAEAIRQLEEMRPNVGGGEETRAAFMGRHSSRFETMVAWQIEADDLPSAFEYAERGRARVLLDQLAAGQVDIRRSIPSDIRESLETREHRARMQMAEFQQKATYTRGRQDLNERARRTLLAAYEDSLAAASRDYQRAYEAIKDTSPLWRSYVTSQGEPVALSTVQRQLVPRDGVLLLYQIGHEQSYLFVIPPAGKQPEVVDLVIPAAIAEVFQLETGTLTRSNLALMLHPAQAMLGDAPRRAAGSEAPRVVHPHIALMHTLRRVLVPDDVWSSVHDAGEVVVIPDGSLHRLPFEALVVDPGSDMQSTRYWLDVGPPIRYAPSATALFNIVRRPSPHGLLGVGALRILTVSDPIYSPIEVAQASERRMDFHAGLTRRTYERVGGSLMRLPGTARETEAIRRAAGDRESTIVVQLQELNATEANVRAAITGKQIVHLATHGIVDERRGSLFAALAFTPPAGKTADPDDDGFLQLNEIYDLDLAATELAVLSSCDSNVGPQAVGEGVFALSRGFLAAGARRVVASQWAVDDESTAALMESFFEEVLADNTSGVDVNYTRALWRARQRVRQDVRWSEPYFWAPFVVIGAR